MKKEKVQTDFFISIIISIYVFFLLSANFFYPFLASIDQMCWITILQFYCEMSYGGVMFSASALQFLESFIEIFLITFLFTHYFNKKILINFKNFAHDFIPNIISLALTVMFALFNFFIWFNIAKILRLPFQFPLIYKTFDIFINLPYYIYTLFIRFYLVNYDTWGTVFLLSLLYWYLLSCLIAKRLNTYNKYFTFHKKLLNKCR